MRTTMPLFRSAPLFSAVQSFVLLSFDSAPPGLKIDDLLDAAAAAWTALRRHRDEAVCVCPPERDEKGLEAAIFY